ncbi:hypothetical protein [Acinetobacter terrestris]|uniref:Lipoprotein n=1 Tax=Acinetobacter terrestris TaxID=2529843 RepID=A0AAW6UQ77_9GAMM|nr:hypothetical protein [Acinetobacter terrestris]MDK1683902.1 hypothetical protein [Acinetobacter terrestris]
MKKLMLLISSTISLVLSGCSAMPMKNSISFQINDHLKGQDVVYRNNWPECSNLSGTPDTLKRQKYITSYSRCKVAPEGYVPQQIIIEYAPWFTYKELIKKGYGIPEELRYANGENAEKKRLAIMDAEQKAIEKIPATAWKRIVLMPPQEVKKYKYQVPEGKGNRSRGKEIHYVISLNPDGSYNIETKLYWVEKYQENWN